VLWVTEEPPDRRLGGGNIRQSYLFQALASVIPTDLLVVGPVTDEHVTSGAVSITELPKRRALWSEHPVGRRALALAITPGSRDPLTAIETEYSLWTRDVEERILPTTRELGIGYVAYSPLGRGFLSGRFASPEDIPEGDFRAHNPRFQGENFRANMRIVERVTELAREHDCTPGQLALAWVLAQGDDIVPIPGTKRRKYLEENVGALEVKLTREDLRRIDEAAPHGATAGTRYPEASMNSVNR